MAKIVKAVAKFELPGGAATPGSKIGASLGQHQVPLMEFCKQFNAQTADRKGQVVPVKVTVYTDKTFSFVVKTSPTTGELKKRASISKGAKTPGKEVAGKITWSAIEEIAKIKMVDLNAVDLEGAKKIVAGSARSMGLEIV